MYAQGVLLGSGTYGCVYEATRDALRVAIKTDTQPKDERCGGINYWVLREITFIAYADHANIISHAGGVYTTRMDDGATCVHQVLEIGDSSLSEYVHRHSDALLALEHIHVKFMNTVTDALALALDYIHACGWLHRDVKITNVLVHKPASTMPHTLSTVDIKLIDFGSAIYSETRRDMSLDTATRIQTRTYRAPEVELKARHYDSKIDMWSVGMLLLELCHCQCIRKNPLDIFHIPDEYYARMDPPPVMRRPEYVPPMTLVPDRISRYTPDISEKVSALLEFFPERRISARAYLTRYARHARAPRVASSASSASAYLRASEPQPEGLGNFHYRPHSLRCAAEWITDIACSGLASKTSDPAILLQTSIRMFNHYMHVVGVTFDECAGNTEMEDATQVVLGCCVAIQAKLRCDRSNGSYEDIAWFGCDIADAETHVNEEQRILETLGYRCFYPCVLDYLYARDTDVNVDVLRRAKIMSVQIMHDYKLSALPAHTLADALYAAAAADTANVHAERIRHICETDPLTAKFTDAKNVDALLDL